MNLCSIASGSSGNCIYIGNTNTGILVDTGISKKRIVDGLTSIDVNPEKLSGIVITHEHSDHICGLGVFTRKYKVPIYATKETISCILRANNLGVLDTTLFHEIKADHPFFLQDIKVNPFAISHDAANPVSYTFCDATGKIGVATDLGTYDEYIISNLEGCGALLLEANHDINMLQVGAYPYSLKRRILSDIGHLSNDNSGRLLSRLFSKQLNYIFLGHLSKENNYPELAYETVRCELLTSGLVNEMEYCMQVANRDMPSEFVTI
ncbi:MAG: MBL fold metallo-hydrolase [Velocimicrobium sp.]